MNHLTLKQVGHRRETNVGVGSNVHVSPSFAEQRPHVIEKDERSHQAALHRRQGTANLETTPEVASARRDHEFNG